MGVLNIHLKGGGKMSQIGVYEPPPEKWCIQISTVKHMGQNPQPQHYLAAAGENSDIGAFRKGALFYCN